VFRAHERDGGSAKVTKSFTVTDSHIPMTPVGVSPKVTCSTRRESDKR
jgi:hypothetical protein